MVEILRNKNLATRFQILAEIANSGPQIQQRDIAKSLNVTPQAISDYIGQLVRDGLLTLDGHSKYKVTQEGVNWIIKVLKELKDYSNFIVEAVNNIAVSTAVAETPLIKGQKVGLEMKDGLLFATGKVGPGARGVAFSDAQADEDVGVREIEGIVELEAARVTILKIPNARNNGSRAVDLEHLKNLIEGKPLIGAVGIEALVAFKKVKAKRVHFFGVKEAVVESAQHGAPSLVACVEDEISGLIKRLEEENLRYELIDLKRRDSG